MFYCEECRIKNEWPKTYLYSYGACELCGRVGTCYDYPSKWLPKKVGWKKETRKKMRVIDLYCGAGGFSKGFEQAGFKIILGVDIWETATENFKLNHPSADVWTMDIADINPKNLPKADIIIGGTPCQEFTSLNLKKQPWRGMINICHFLRVIQKYKPKYWLMENVLGLNKFLPPYLNRYKLRASDFGCKTGRRRLFVGNMPEPEPVNINANPLRTSVSVNNIDKINSPVFDVEDLIFRGSEKEIRQLQVNCVPPKVAKAIAMQVRKRIL